jgi:hypothetical protein
MKNTRTNLSINIQYNNIKEVEAVLYKILNELDGPATFGSGTEEKVAFNYVRESFTVEALSNNRIMKTFKSKL